LSIYNGAKHCAAHYPKHLRMAATGAPTDTMIGPDASAA
jgi:hypothetical protein